MNLNEIKHRLKNLDSKSKTRIIVIVGICGMMLILFSELLPGSDKEESTVTAEKSYTESTDDYKLELENELKSILSQIKGVGEIDVMITLDGTEEYVYAEELDTDTTHDSSKTSDKYKNKIVMNENGGSKNALVKKTMKPKVSGVIIVCGGGGDLNLKERIIKAAGAVLDLSSDKICVECKK